jgi:hypothetical protein
MEAVIEGIERGDTASIALGLDFIEEDAHFPFGKTLKSNTARALRRASLTAEQVLRVRKRVTNLLEFLKLRARRVFKSVQDGTYTNPPHMVYFSNLPYLFPPRHLKHVYLNKRSAAL